MRVPEGGAQAGTALFRDRSFSISDWMNLYFSSTASTASMRLLMILSSTRHNSYEDGLPSWPWTASCALRPAYASWDDSDSLASVVWLHVSYETNRSPEKALTVAVAARTFGSQVVLT